MKTYDCQLDHHPLIRLSAEDEKAAKAEYFRRYAISASNAPWTCVEAKAGTPTPVEPDTWVNRRKQLGTLEEAKPVEAVKPVDSPVAKTEVVKS